MKDKKRENIRRARLAALAAALSLCLAGGLSGCAAALTGAPAIDAPPLAAGYTEDAGGESEELGTAWYAFKARCAGAVVSLPLEFSSLESLGWQVQNTDGVKLLYGQSVSLNCDTGAGNVRLCAANMADGLLPLEQCLVIGLATADENAAELVFPAEVKNGTPYERVLQLYGPPDAESGETKLSYTAGPHSSVNIWFSGGKAARFEVTRALPPQGPPDMSEMPQNVRAYEAPKELGSDIWSYRLNYAGNLYTLPAPAAGFMENGWVLEDTGTVPAGGFRMGVTLRLGNQVLRTTLYNYSGEEQPLSACFIVMAEYCPPDMALEFSLPGGIGGDVTYEEAVAAMGLPDETEEDMNSYSITYYGPNDGKLVLRFVPSETLAGMALFDIEFWHTAL